jgi:hypothetical protein
MTLTYSPDPIAQERALEATSARVQAFTRALESVTIANDHDAILDAIGDLNRAAGVEVQAWIASTAFANS